MPLASQGLEGEAGLSKLERPCYNTAVMAALHLLLGFLQFTLSIALVVAVLLHTAKGEGLAAIGGSAQLFGSQKGVEAGLNRVTSVIAGLWFAVAIAMALLARAS